jgi:purine-binding chemotaxis protein CheW
VWDASQRKFLILESAGETYAVAIGEAREIVPIANLIAVPGSSTLLVGFLNLHGRAIPVVRIEARAPEVVPEPGLSARILILLDNGQPLGVLVDSVTEIVEAAEEALGSYNSAYVFGDCVTGFIESAGRKIPVLSAERLLLMNERVRVAEFQETAQKRIYGLGGAA